MSGAIWENIVSPSLGILGAFTGVGGLIAAMVANRKVSRIKTLDLRIELRRIADIIRIEALDLIEKIDQARSSRYAVAETNGLRGSGAMTQWINTYAKDYTYISDIISQFEDEADFRGLPDCKLEDNLVECHKLKERLSRIRSKYADFLNEDTEDRKRIADDRRTQGLSFPRGSSF